MKKFLEYNKINEGKEQGLTFYQLFVVRISYANDTGKIYLSKEDAEKARDKYIEEYYNHYRKVNKKMSDEEFKDYIKSDINKIKVIDLYTLIYEKIEDAVDSSNSIYNEDY